jgi:hypothetical protein
VKNCKAGARDGHLMCAGHWRLVPHDLQQRVWTTWHAYRVAIRPTNLPRTDAALMDRLRATRAYQDAAADAIAAVERKAL